MPDRTVNIEAVAAVIDEAARTLVIPRWKNLGAAEIDAKETPDDPKDIVTVVDRQVEEHLSQALTGLIPAAVLGEEAAQDRPDLLRLLASDQPLWIIDPIDGTKNFAAGDDGFGIMVAWFVNGQTQAAWIVLPARRQTFVAEVGGGSFLNGERICVPHETIDERPRGVVMSRYMPGDLGETVARRMERRFRPMPPTGSAAIEYTEILQGKRDFVVYYRLLPWDHAAPALILTEAGGCVAHVAGGLYTVRSQNQLTVVARDDGIARRLRAWLERDRLDDR